MKMLIFLSAVLTVAASLSGDSPKVETWLLPQIDEAISKMKYPALMPFLFDAKKKLTEAMFTRKKSPSYNVLIPSPSHGTAWDRNALKKVIKDRNFNAGYKYYFWKTYMKLKQKGRSKNDTIEVAIPAVDISTWTLKELDETEKNISINDELITYLSKARYNLIKKRVPGPFSKRNITIVTPVGLLPHEFSPFELASKSLRQNQDDEHFELSAFEESDWNL